MRKCWSQMCPQSNMTGILLRQLCKDRDTQEPCEDVVRGWRYAAVSRFVLCLLSVGSVKRIINMLI